MNLFNAFGSTSVQGIQASAPTITGVTISSTTQINIAFSGGSYFGKNPNGGYIAYAYPQPSGTAITGQAYALTAPATYPFTGLTTGQSYKFAIAKTNGGSVIGKLSTLSDAITPQSTTVFALSATYNTAGTFNLTVPSGKNLMAAFGVGGGSGGKAGVTSTPGVGGYGGGAFALTAVGVSGGQVLSYRVGSPGNANTSGGITSIGNYAFANGANTTAPGNGSLFMVNAGTTSTGGNSGAAYSGSGGAASVPTLTMNLEGLGVVNFQAAGGGGGGGAGGTGISFPTQLRNQTQFGSGGGGGGSFGGGNGGLGGNATYTVRNAGGTGNYGSHGGGGGGGGGGGNAPGGSGAQFGGSASVGGTGQLVVYFA